MAKGPLRQSIEDFFFTNFEPEGGEGWWARVRARWVEYKLLMSAYRERTPACFWSDWQAIIGNGAGYVLLGIESCKVTMAYRLTKAVDTDSSQAIADVMKTIFSQPEAAEIVETLGAFITDPVINIFEQYAAQEDPDPKEFARAFHGFMIGLNVSGALVDTALETVTAGQVEGAGRFLQSIYWSLGLGFLGWQTLAPLLESGLQPGLTRHYQELYRPKRFSASELRDLYALDKLSKQELRNAAKVEGWRDGDIEQWIDLAFRTLPQGDIWQGYHQGLIDKTECTQRLRALGFSPDDIPLLYNLNPTPVVDEERSISASTVRRAYREHLMSAQELRTTLEGLRYSAREVALIVAIEDVSIASEAKILQAAQIREAWEENVLTDPEALHWMADAGYEMQSAQIMLSTWRSAIVPEFRKLNVGTITAAYVEAVITRAQALARLQEIGLEQDDAILELDLAEARNPEKFGIIAPPPIKLLTPGMLTTLVVLGLITLPAMQAKLIELNYTPEDAHLLMQAAELKAIPTEVEIPQRSVERAYAAGVVDRVSASRMLQMLGFDAGQAEIILETIDAEIYVEPPPTPEEKIRQLTPGMLRDLRIAGHITSVQMFDYLVLLAFSSSDAALLVERAEEMAQPVEAILDKGLIERAYIAQVITRQQAHNKLLELDYADDDVILILDTFELEHPEVFDDEFPQSIRQPTIAALVAALQKGILTEDEYYARAAEIGYRQADAMMYLAIAVKQERKSSKTLTPAQITAAYDAGLYDWSFAVSQMTQRGYSDLDAQVILRTRKDLIENTDAWGQMLSGNIDAFACLSELLAMDYADKDILKAFQTMPAGYVSALGINLRDLADFLAEEPGGVL